MFASAGMMAADGRCKTLDAAADGYVRGEACMVVKLRCGCWNSTLRLRVCCWHCGEPCNLVVDICMLRAQSDMLRK